MEKLGQPGSLEVSDADHVITTSYLISCFISNEGKQSQNAVKLQFVGA